MALHIYINLHKLGNWSACCGCRWYTWRVWAWAVGWLLEETRSSLRYNLGCHLFGESWVRAEFVHWVWGHHGWCSYVTGEFLWTASLVSFISSSVSPPYPTVNLRRPSFRGRRRSGLEQSSSARHICVNTLHLLHSCLFVLAKWRCHYGYVNRFYLLTYL